ncbi:MAG: transposon-encoded TnpW family protein [Oscillospiraceae bacterium]|nr:transposon-encoded TnpW family protein [Oscillospiraceae bacterium]
MARQSTCWSIRFSDKSTETIEDKILKLVEGGVSKIA